MTNTSRLISVYNCNWTGNSVIPTRGFVYASI